jgi:hypothetical protein
MGSSTADDVLLDHDTADVIRPKMKC